MVRRIGIFSTHTPQNWQDKDQSPRPRRKEHGDQVDPFAAYPVPSDRVYQGHAPAEGDQGQRHPVGEGRDVAEGGPHGAGQRGEWPMAPEVDHSVGGQKESAVDGVSDGQVEDEHGGGVKVAVKSVQLVPVGVGYGS